MPQNYLDDNQWMVVANAKKITGVKTEESVIPDYGGDPSFDRCCLKPMMAVWSSGTVFIRTSIAVNRK